MVLLTTLATLDFDDALADVDGGAAFVDLRATQDYLDAHIPGSIGLLYEAGPGLPSRARDCLPLEQPLILEDARGIDLRNAAAALRGKGFSVLGKVDEPLARWRAARGEPASTEMLFSPPADEVILDVGDPGATAPPGVLRIPIEKLYGELDQLRGVDRIVIASGYGVRAAIAVGLLERAGVKKIQLWRSPRA